MNVKALEFVEENYGADDNEAAIPILHSLSMVRFNWNMAHCIILSVLQVAQLSGEYTKSTELLKRAHTITLDHHGKKSVNAASSNQLQARAHLLLWQHSNTKLSLEDGRKLLEESLQVYRQVKGVRDPDTLKCHVSQFPFMVYTATMYARQKEYCRLLVLMEQHMVSYLVKEFHRVIMNT